MEDIDTSMILSPWVMQSIKEIANEYMLLSASQHEFRHIQYYTKVDTVTQLLLDMH